jgi:NTE family protein
MDRALVLSGGGARGAYQAGVLLGLRDIGYLGSGKLPFDIIVGASAGSINSAAIAAYAHQISTGVDELIEVWGRVRARQVFRTDLAALATTAYRWVRDLSLGGLLGGTQPKALLNTEPLAKLLRRLPLENIQPNLEAGLFQALAISATNYATTQGVIFLQAHPNVPRWERARYNVQPVQLTIPHLLASSAIPIFFPAVPIEGSFYGDGCIRNTTPLSPAIRLGAKRILAVGVRETLAQVGNSATEPPSLATVAGVLLDAVMIDALETDVAHCQRLNRMADVPSKVERRRGGRTMKHLDVCWIKPSRSIAQIALKLDNQIPYLIRYLLRGLGDKQSTAELASYLLFDSSYCHQLIELGRQDAYTARPELDRFFSDSNSEEC